MKNKISRSSKIFAYSTVTLAIIFLSVNTDHPSCEKVFNLNHRPDADYRLVRGSSASLTAKQNNTKALQDAVKAGIASLKDPNVCRTTVRISEGSWYFAPRVEGDDVILRVPDMPRRGEKVLAISGVEGNLAKIYIEQNQTFVRNLGAINNFQLDGFSLIQIVPSTMAIRTQDRNGNIISTTYTYGLKTTQGTVTKDDRNFIEVRIPQGYPHPIALDSVKRGECVPKPPDVNGNGEVECEDKFLKRFAVDVRGRPFFPFNEVRAYPIPANPRPNNYRVAFTRVENVNADGSVVRIYVNNSSSATGERVFIKDDLVAFKSKHGGLLLYLFDCSELLPGECKGLTFSGLSFVNEARGVIRNVDSVSVLDNRIERTPAIGGQLPALATTAGGFQINGGKDHEVRDNVMIGLGDDGIAFFDILGTPDSTRISGNRIEDSWNRGIYIRNSRVVGDSETISNDNCVLERGCARVDGSGNKLEFKMLFFRKPADEAPLFKRTYIDYAGAVDDES